MSIAQTIERKIGAMPSGQLFGYRELPEYTRSPEAVAKAVSRMVFDGKIKRFSKGKFYVPEKGILGERRPSDNELIRSVLYKGGELRGYVTDIALYNRLGLTTQLPRTITIAFNGGYRKKDFGTISIKTKASRAPVKEEDIELLQYLDVLQGIKNIPDAEINQSLCKVKMLLSELSVKKRERLLKLALNFYPARVRALAGMLYTELDYPVPMALKKSLNPTTTYKLKLSSSEWPLARDWNIQ